MPKIGEPFGSNDARNIHLLRAGALLLLRRTVRDDRPATATLDVQFFQDDRRNRRFTCTAVGKRLGDNV